ncbi:ribosome maturation factor RimP [Nannocystaceae bacterium ST9]
MTLDPAPSSPARLLEAAVSAVVGDMGFELLLLEWLGVGKRRVMRLYLDSPKGVTVEDCSRMSRIVGAALDAAEAAAKAGQGDPLLASLLDRPYTLEVSSPGVDRPLASRRHFEQYVGSKLKLETLEPLGLPGMDPREHRFTGRIVAVQDDSAQPDDPEAAIVVIADGDHDRTLQVPLTRIRRANLVWEG